MVVLPRGRRAAPGVAAVLAALAGWLPGWLLQETQVGGIPTSKEKAEGRKCAEKPLLWLVRAVRKAARANVG